MAKLIPVLLILAGCGLDPCENTIVTTLPSPGGRWQAILFERSCGATTGFTTQVSIIPTGQSLAAEGGNAFIADKGDVSAPWGGPPAEIRWLADNHLQITFHPSARVELERETVDGVRVTYSAAP